MSKLFQFTLFGCGCFALGSLPRGIFWLPVETRIVHQEVSAIEIEPVEPPVAVLEVPEEPEVVEPFPSEVSASAPAAYRSPTEQFHSLEQIVNQKQRGQALQKMMYEWIEQDPALSNAEKESLRMTVQQSALPGGGVPVEVSLSSVIGRLSSRDLRSAWKAAYLDSPVRAAIFSELAASDLEGDSPAALLEATDGWTQWERGRYRDALLSSLAQTDLDTAMRWGIEDPDAFSAAGIHELFLSYSKSDYRGLEQALSQIDDPRSRAAAIQVLVARRITNTEAALEWADSLATPEEQALAHEAIYDMTPRGIGVSVFNQDGFSKVGDVVRIENGLRVGDRIVGVSEGGAEQVDLFGRDLEDVVDLLRGEPGTDVTVQVLRDDLISGEVQQVEMTITREQLYFE